MKEDKIHSLNETLEQAATDLKNNRIVLPDRMNDLLASSADYSDMTLLLEEELERDQNVFLDFKEDELKNFRDLQTQEERLTIEKSNNAKNQEYEQAARTRDKLRKVEDAKYREILRLNNFQEGFNSYKGCVLVVRPEDSFKANIVDRFIREKSKNTTANK